MNKKGVLVFLSCLVIIFLSGTAIGEDIKQVWVAYYNSPVSTADFARALALDRVGNLYVTGWSEGLGSSDDFLTIKYSSTGDSLWVKRYNGPENFDDRATSMAVDDSGNIFVSGTSQSAFTSWDYVTIKYTPTGETLWSRRYNGTGSGEDIPYATVVDKDGNIVVTGESMGKSTSYDFATVKYSPSGDILWVRRYDGSGNRWDRAYALAVDDSGYVYVAGASSPKKGYSDYATIKYSSKGEILWTSRYSGPNNGSDYPIALAVDHKGNVYVTGYSQGDKSFDYATIKYNSQGETVWVKRYDEGKGATERPFALKLDENGNVYITGCAGIKGRQDFKDTTTSGDFLTIKYSPDGDTLWARKYNGPGNGGDLARAMAIDKVGNVYVTGYSWGKESSADYATIKYSPQGDSLWVKRFNGPFNVGDYPYAIAVDDSGSVYVTGFCDATGVFPDFATIKYSKSDNKK